MTDRDLEKLRDKWAKVLRIRDWNIRIFFVRHFELGLNEKGDCQRFPLTRNAVVRIVSEIDQDPNWLGPVDIEETVLHELVHILLTPLDKNSPDVDTEALEVTVHLITGALLALDRK